MHHCKKRITAKGRISFRTLALAVAIAACLPAYAATAEAGATRETVVNFDIPAGDLSVALERFSTQSSIQAMYRQELVAGKRVPKLKGAYSPSAALTRLLGGGPTIYKSKFVRKRPMCSGKWLEIRVLASRGVQPGSLESGL